MVLLAVYVSFEAPVVAVRVEQALFLHDVMVSTTVFSAVTTTTEVCNASVGSALVSVMKTSVAKVDLFP